MSTVSTAAATFFKLREAAKIGNVPDDVMDSISVAEDTAVLGLARAIVESPELKADDAIYALEAAKFLADDLRGGDSPRLVLVLQAVVAKLDSAAPAEGEPAAPLDFGSMTNAEKLRATFADSVAGLPAMFASKAA